MTRIEDTFARLGAEGRKAFVAFVMAGDPDPEASLAIIRGLQQRYPHNPLFHQIEAEILDVYFHDHAASLKASERLLALAASRSVFHADIAERVARRNIAKQSVALKAPKPKLD